MRKKKANSSILWKVKDRLEDILIGTGHESKAFASKVGHSLYGHRKYFYLGKVLEDKEVIEVEKVEIEKGWLYQYSNRKGT